MKNLKLIYIALLSLVVAACSDGTRSSEGKNEDGGKKPSEIAFADDGEFLDWLQRTHFNYMWDGAETTSGLAPERIHLDNVYPQNDRDVVTTGGSGFGIAGIITRSPTISPRPTVTTACGPTGSTARQAGLCLSVRRTTAATSSKVRFS